jgi:ATP-dependent Clp protease ATP-binding subunit ClpC
MKLTPRAQQAFRLAEAEARSFGHSPTGSHHLVLGLFLLESGVHFQILKNLGCTIPSLQQAVKMIGTVPAEVKPVSGFELGASAVLALERASDEADAMSHTYVGTEHILLGLLFEEQAGPASRLFAAHHIDRTKARNEILNEYGQRR